MSTHNNKQLDRLKALLKELFQLDKPELDFGLYKIMHAKSKQISEFLDKDLLKEIESAFGAESAGRVQHAELKVAEAIEQAKSFGAADPEATPPVIQARAAYKLALEGGNTEAEIYDHLYRFFERYYDNGDFLSKRYYARENDSRAAPYSVPYDGREVYLHWANKDQYYIKSGEYLNNFSFDLTEAVRLHREAPTKAGQALDFGTAATPEGPPLKVHMHLAQAQEGEHGNIKAAADQKREFIPLLTNPVALNELGELVLNFEYKVLPDGYPIDAATEAALKAAYEVKNKGDVPAHWMADVFLKALPKKDKRYAALLAQAIPTDTQKKRPLLAKYIQQYTARNTMDYFIHKDLGGFLKRELDFYIKNELMRLDDIESAEAPRVEDYLGKIKALRRIAHQLIAFLAQLEDFQKKLWLKKKFVTETNYCITLDRVPESLYPAVAANDAQREEWVKLFAIDDIAGDTAQVGYSVPLTVEFLKGNPFLLVDTALFADDFKANLLTEIEDLDAQCDGVLIHSENSQALGLMNAKLKEKVKFIYIDPPYNTGDDGFSYKDGYKSATWLSMISDRVKLGRGLNTNDGVIFASIDDKEVHNLDWALSTSYGFDPDVYPMIWHLPRGINAGHIAKAHEYILPYFVNRAKTPKFNKPSGLEQISIERCNKQIDARHPASEITFPAGLPFEGESATFTDEIPGSERIEIVSKKMVFENGKLKFPVTLSAGWTVKNMILTWLDDKPVFDSKGQPIKRFFFKTNGKLYYEKYVNTFSSKSVITGIADTQDATAELLSILGVNNFTYPKSSEITKYLMQLATNKNDYLLDYFAGSGTTGHAALKINREDGGSRKFILVEMGEYFDEILKPRIQKAVFSNAWENGKPINRDGISHCFKYLRLESYEDTLNNLSLQTDPARERALADNPALRQDYVLNYWLDVETQGSQSLLNVAAFRDPTAYTLRIKQPGSDVQRRQRIDLIETLNWLIGLWVEHMAAPQLLEAEFKREVDPQLPKDQNTRLVCKRIKPAAAGRAGAYWFRLVEGYTLKVPGDDSSRQKTLVVWRKLTDNPEQDNAVLLHFLMEKLAISPREHTYAVIYVNGSHTLPNPVIEGEQTKVRLIEEAFHNAMWSQDGA
jgi:adenine-specific DNA-methyltransferase